MADTIRRVYEIDAKIATTAAQSLREIQRNLREVEASAKAAGKGTKEAGKDIEEGASAFSHLNFQSVGARRELLVLAHELSQGNFKAFAGSLLVLGERIDATRLIMSAGGLTAIAFAAAVAVVAVAVAHGALEQDKYNKSLILTGNASGTTNDSIQALAKTVAGSTSATAGSVQVLAQALAATGEVGPKAFGPIVEAMTRIKKLTGETADEVAAKFKNFAAEPTKSALEFNKQLNFLDSALYQQIKRLEDLGDKQGAAALAADSITAALKDRQLPTVGYLVLGYEALGRGLDRISHYFGSIGAETTFEAKLDSLYKKLGDLQARANNPSFLDKLNKFFDGSSGSENEEAQAAARADINAAIRAKTDKDNKARLDAEAALIKREGVQAQQELDILDKQTKGYSRKQKAMEELARQEAAIVRDRQRTDPSFQIDPAVHAARVAEIERQNRTQADKSLENAITSRLRSLGEEDAQLKEQIKQYEEYGRKITNAARAKVDFDLKSGSLRGASPAVALKLQSAADLVDSDQTILKQKQAEAQADRRITQLREEAAAHATNAREVQIAIELGKLETDGLVKGTPAYEERARKVRQYTNEIHDNALARKLSAAEDSTADEARSITDQIDLIGKSTIEREKYVATLRIQREVTKELNDNPDNAFEIIASAQRRIELLTEALDKNYEAQRKFESGAKTAFTTYTEEASNASKFSNEVITGGLKRVEDIFVNFAKTGKLNFKDLFTYMADEFIRQSVRMSISGILKEGGTEGAITSALKSLGSVFGVNFGGDATKAAAGAAGSAVADTSLSTLATSSTTVTASLTVLDTTLLTVDVGLTTLTAAAELAATALASVSASSGGSAIAGAASDFDWSSLFDYAANGGLMSSKGMMPLNTYSGGGIANSPQMAIFGEGRMNEAYVPLPDGRSIPVTVKSTTQGESGGPMNVTIENHNGSDVGIKRQKNALGKDELRIFIRAAKQEMLDDIYGGGEFDKALSDKYGIDRAGGTPRSG